MNCFFSSSAKALYMTFFSVLYRCGSIVLFKIADVGAGGGKSCPKGNFRYCQIRIFQQMGADLQTIPEKILVGRIAGVF